MKKILIIEARFYENLAYSLADGAISVLEKSAYEFERISVPGAFEIPAAISMAIASGKYAGFIALGCVIRGETTHYDYVCGESARGINELALKHNAAIGFGIITAENGIQAEVRADKTKKNVGGRAAEACLAMLLLKEKFMEKKE
jgi:6,7-dimethyl-8-ribityllumazine synthase